MTSFAEDNLNSDLTDGKVLEAIIIGSIRTLKEGIRNIVRKSCRIQWGNPYAMKFVRIWSHLLKKSLMENFIFCAVTLDSLIESPPVNDIEKLIKEVPFHRVNWPLFCEFFEIFKNTFLIENFRLLLKGLWLFSHLLPKYFNDMAINFDDENYFILLGSILKVYIKVTVYYISIIYKVTSCYL